MTVAAILLNIALVFSTEGDTLGMERADSLLAARGAEVALSRIGAAEARASAAQARRLGNPEVGALYNVYNPVNGRWLDAGADGEVDIGLSQPLPVGRRHRVAAADAAVRAADASAGHVLLCSRMEMRRQMCEAAAADERAALVGAEVECVERVLAAYRRAPQVVSAAEVRRVEALRLSLLAEQAERRQAALAAKAGLAATLGLGSAQFVLPPLALSTAADTTAGDEPPLLLALRAGAEAAEAEVRLQRALAWPQVSLSVEYDKNGNIGHNFWAVGATLTLPLFDRNQEAIRHAELQCERQCIERRRAELDIALRASLAADRLGQARTLVAEAEALAGWDMAAVERQYLAHNISLLEFVDLLAAHREAQEMLVDARLALFGAAIDYNLAVGKEIHVIR